MRVSFKIMRGKIANIAKVCDLIGQEPDLAIWASDIRHQGRGSVDRIKEAVSHGSLEEKREALFAIDNESNSNLSRRETVLKCIERLAKEERFKGVKFGSGPLAV